MNTKAQFITLDGVDGAGKSTNLAIIKEWFHRQGLPVLFTREPGGTPLGESLRQLLLDPETKISLRSETLLMFAARQQHLESVILPALSDGIHVVSDRFTDATYAYQGGGRGIPESDIEMLENWVQGDFRPDFTLLLDLPLDIALERLNQNREKDRFEVEEAAFFERVRQVYLQRAAQYPKRYAIINSHQTLDQVRLQIESQLASHFNISK